MDVVAVGLLVMSSFRFTPSVSPSLPLVDSMLSTTLAFLSQPDRQSEPVEQATKYSAAYPPHTSERPQPGHKSHRTVATAQSPRAQGKRSAELAARGRNTAITGI